MLKSRLPRDINHNKEDEDAKEALSRFHDIGDFTWLPAEQMHEINMKRVKEGEKPLKSKFGAFEDDKPNLERIHRMARTDFEWYSNHIEETIFKWEQGSEPERNDMRELMKNGADAHLWTPEDEQDMTKWLADYLQWAGYGNPARNPRVWKGLIMMHFPLIMENGLKNEAFFEDPTTSWKLVNRWMRSSLRIDDEMLKPFTDTISKLNIAFLRPAGLS
jgi:hypothetical protein